MMFIECYICELQELQNICIVGQPMECNRFVAYWETKRNWDIHTKKLQNIQPVLKTKTVKNFSPSKDRNKSLNQPAYSHRSFEIEMENKALLSKLTRQESHRRHHLTERQPAPVVMGRTRRGKYYAQYEKENRNRDLLQKIKGVKPSYNMNHQVRDYKQKEKYMNLICKFPVRGMKPTKTLLKLEMINHRRESFEHSFSKSRVKQRSKSRTKSIEPLVNKKQQQTAKPPQKITKILRVKKQHIDNIEFLIKGVQYETYLKLQLHSDTTMRQLQIDLQQLTNRYHNDYNRLCESIGYEQECDMFYLQ